MRTELRRKNPYFGKYKFKIHIYNRKWISGATSYPQRHALEQAKQEKVRDFLSSTWKKDVDFKWRDGWNVYLRDEDVFDDVVKNFPDYISWVYRPAPGFEHLDGKGELKERILWFDKFPYKITLAGVDRNTNHTQLKWCEENLEGDVRVSSGSKESSFYLMTSFDAMAFKLAFSDIVNETFVADKKKAEKMLKNRMNTAIQEYHDYLEGENVKTRK